MITSLLFYKYSFTGQNMKEYKVGSFMFSSEGIIFVNFSDFKPSFVSYRLELCKVRFFKVTDKCENYPQAIFHGQTYFYLNPKSGIYDVKLVPQKISLQSSESFTIIFKNGTLFYDIRDIYLLGLLIFLIMIALVLLIVYMSHVSGYIKKLHSTVILSTIGLTICYALLSTRYIVLIFTGMDIFPNNISYLCHSIAFSLVLFALSAFSMASTYSGVFPTYCTKFLYLLCYILDGVLIFASQAWVTNRWAVLSIAIVNTVLILLMSTLLRLKSRYDFMTTFNLNWPKEIHHLSFDCLVTLYVIIILYDIVLGFRLFLDDFMHIYSGGSILIFSLGLFCVVIFSNRRLDLIILNGKPLLTV